jgi:hypothetical protein
MWRGRGGWWASSGASRDSTPRRLHDAAAEPLAGAVRSGQQFAVATLAAKPLPEKASLRRATRSVARWPPPCPCSPSRRQGGGQAPGRAQVRGPRSQPATQGCEPGKARLWCASPRAFPAWKRPPRGAPRREVPARRLAPRGVGEERIQALAHVAASEPGEVLEPRWHVGTRRLVERRLLRFSSARRGWGVRLPASLQPLLPSAR